MHASAFAALTSIHTACHALLAHAVDAMVEGWTREQKDACIAETANSFKQGGALLGHLREPPK